MGDLSASERADEKLPGRMMIILYFPETLLSPSLSKYFLSRLPMEPVKNVLKLPMESVKKCPETANGISQKCPEIADGISQKCPETADGISQNVLKLPMESVILKHQKREVGAQ